MKYPIFGLTKNAESATIRFLCNSIDDIKLTARDRKDSPIFAATPEDLLLDANKQFANKYYIPIHIYDESDGLEKIWVRGISSYRTMEQLFHQYKNVPELRFRIVRHGDFGSIHTSYEINYVGKVSEIGQNVHI